MVHTLTNKVVLLLALIALNASAAFRADSGLLLEIQRGFHESAKCITGGVDPLQWYVCFQNLIDEEVQPTSPGFLIGANFGFSYRAETTAEAVGASDATLLQIAEHALVARLRFERLKQLVGASDMDVISALDIRPQQFSNWKSRAVTQERDRSVIRTQRGVEL
jgi:hypothetical protein